MTRILAEEGVNQALAYGATQRPGILEKFKARADDAREKNRSDLLPLVKSAQLEAERNYPAEAEHLFADILALEPDWAEARNAFAWFLIQRGQVIDVYTKADLPQDLARTQNNLDLALKELAKRSR
jgi:hypothetical protein